jgi:CBS domain-containing protein
MSKAHHEPHTPLTIAVNASTSEAIDRLNRCSATLTLIVVDERDRVVGTLTDGDFRRWLRPTNGPPPSDKPLELSKISVRQVMHPSPVVAMPPDSWFDKITEARDQERERGIHIRLIPVLNQECRLVDVLDLFVSKQRTRLEAILMAKARLEDVNERPEGGKYMPCTTHEAVSARRQRYETIRYAYELDKYAALQSVIETEFSAIKNRRRLDELYMALKRGQDWARSFSPPSDILQQTLESLSGRLEEAKTTLIIKYISETTSSLT